LALLLMWGTQAQAHFAMVIPSTPTVADKKDANVQLEISIVHPLEMQGMDMAAPAAATVTHDGKTEDIKATLKPATVLGHKAWQTTYGLKKPGVFQFAVEP
ncbi:DUF4198 domain-containing protein, partial [Desulfovibrio desulfuricans]|uniref:DUF4198 domain-containing protein n=1 Tax=Desulfovibrio desulfuricans TaxID=876 RepID=UPI00319DF5A8